MPNEQLAVSNEQREELGREPLALTRNEELVISNE
jgi:hypothetical protein